MSYKEFRSTYSWMLDEYPETENIYKEDMSEVIGQCEIIHFSKAGTRWKEDSRQTEPLTRYYYANVIDAVPFFKGLGGSERVGCSYTKLGYIPTEVSSISPDKQQKTLRIFRIK